MSELLPDGIADVRDCPHGLFEAIRQGLVYLSFLELPKDEQPRRSIWTDGDALRAHFDGVEAKRQRAAKGEEIEDPVDNKAAEALIVG